MFKPDSGNPKSLYASAGGMPPSVRPLAAIAFAIAVGIATMPPRVEYELTEMGHSLTATLVPLAHWSEANWQAIRLAQERHDARSMRDPE